MTDIAKLHKKPITPNAAETNIFICNPIGTIRFLKLILIFKNAQSPQTLVHFAQFVACFRMVFFAFRWTWVQPEMHASSILQGS